MGYLQRDDSDVCDRIKEAGCVLFRSKGFDNTTVADLLVKVNIEEQVFFSYFESLDELLEVVWSES